MKLAAKLECLLKLLLVRSCCVTVGKERMFMPESFMTLFPQVLNTLEATKVPVQMSANLAEAAMQSWAMAFDLTRNTYELSCQLMKDFLPLAVPRLNGSCRQLFDMCHEGADGFVSLAEKSVLDGLGRFHQRRQGELEFIKLFIEQPPVQDWSIEYDNTNVLLDLPGLRLIDISLDVKHKIQNYGVVFAPRAGHHSNIAERVAFYMRDHGITRMAVVEQKCADDIPLYVGGMRHHEDFEGQVDQYKAVLKHLKGLTGYPSHLVAICQPGPLLITTLILNPHLAKTFGSAGAPMHTEGEKGYLTDFARLVGEKYIDRLISFFGHTVSKGHKGAGRESYDGRLQVLGFYLLGMDQHIKNMQSLLSDLRQRNGASAKRQKTFYQWYHFVQHSPAGFIRDTYKKIFIRNDLIRGELMIGGKKVSIKDYPGSVPLWALGGTRDEIAPPLQATGHMALIKSVPPEDKLTLLCDGGHMGIFRSSKILKEHYSRIVDFILSHSDRTKNKGSSEFCVL
jgi:polyhydroxyalkanoate depolymerase